MAISGPVQQATGTSSAANSTSVTIAAPAAGNTLVLCFGSNGTTISSVTGGGVTWVAAKVGSNGATARAEIWYGTNSTGVGTAITINHTTTSTNGEANVSEWSGLSVNSALDKVPANNNTGTAVDSGVFAISDSNEVLFAVACCAGAVTLSSGPTGSFNALTSAASGSLMLPAYKIDTTRAASEQCHWVISASAIYCTVGASFRGDVAYIPAVVDALPIENFAPLSGHLFPAPLPAMQFEEMTAWTDFVILPSAGGIAQQMEDYQAHDVLGGRHYHIPAPARQLEEMTAWTQRVIIPAWVDESLPEQPFNRSLWFAPDDESEWGEPASVFLPPFDPTLVSQTEQTDVYGRAWTMLEDTDSPLNVFLPAPAWDDDWLYSRQPQMRIDDDREYLMRIFIPVQAYDDDWQMATQPQVKMDDDREYLMRIFIPVVGWDDDWQMAKTPTAQAEEGDSPLQLFLPPFDPTQRPAGEDVQFAATSWARVEEADSPLILFLPPFDPTQRPAGEDGEFVTSGWARHEERDAPLLIFLPPSPWTEDIDGKQRPQPPAQLSVEPEGEWIQIIVVLTVPPPGEIPGRSAFQLRRGVHIFR